MPAIDLARLRKQASRLADFYFLPDEFVRQLEVVLDSYVNYTMRKRSAAGPALHTPTHRTPTVVLREIEQAIGAVAGVPENADATLSLADRLWEEIWLEDRLLAAFLLGRIAPQEGPLIARLTAWVSQVRDPQLSASLLQAGLARMRKEAPTAFLHLVAEWLRPERPRLWSDAIRASIAAISDGSFTNLPLLLDALQPVVRSAPAELQLDLEALILSLYRIYPTETTYFVRQVLSTSDNPLTAITFRRMAPAFPLTLQEEIREFVKGKPFSLV